MATEHHEEASDDLNINAKLAGIEDRLSARIARELEFKSAVVEQERKAWSDFKNSIQIFGVILVVTAGLLGWFGLKSYLETIAAIEGSIVSGLRAEAGDLAELRASFTSQYEDAMSGLDELFGDISSYRILLNQVQTDNDLDPLLQYTRVSAEIERRKDSSAEHRAGSPVPIENTFYDPAFRTESISAFSAMLVAAEGIEQAVLPTISGSDYYNAAANASLIQMDATALWLIEAASKITRGAKPEIEMRFLRQQLAFSRIS